MTQSSVLSKMSLYMPLHSPLKIKLLFTNMAFEVSLTFMCLDMIFQIAPSIEHAITYFTLKMLSVYFLLVIL